jgi:glycosyltransferase involved in cell wall biosynthesis
VTNPPRLSVVLPLYNEADSVEPLLARLHEALAGYPAAWEAILVDDGSSDDTLARLRAGRERYGSHVHVLELERNFGQTAAMQAGIDAARGEVIATLDADLQNDPIDIPRMVGRLQREDLDLVVGWRRERKDSLWLRKVPSKIANALIGRLTGVRLHDYGCSLKVYRASIAKRVRLYGEMHRFIPTWLATVTSPRRIREEVVAHHPRRYGQSKYGLKRTGGVILDLLSMYFFLRYRSRPGHFFGGLGLAVGLAGGAILGYLGYLKFGLGQDIGGRPLLLIGIVLVIAAVQLLTTGVLAEMLTRTYYESTRAAPYAVRTTTLGEPAAGWFGDGR